MCKDQWVQAFETISDAPYKERSFGTGGKVSSPSVDLVCQTKYSSRSIEKISVSLPENQKTMESLRKQRHKLLEMVKRFLRDSRRMNQCAFWAVSSDSWCTDSAQILRWLTQKAAIRSRSRGRNERTRKVDAGHSSYHIRLRFIIANIRKRAYSNECNGWAVTASFNCHLFHFGSGRIGRVQREAFYARVWSGVHHTFTAKAILWFYRPRVRFWEILL